MLGISTWQRYIYIYIYIYIYNYYIINNTLTKADIVFSSIQNKDAKLHIHTSKFITLSNANTTMVDASDEPNVETISSLVERGFN